VASVAGLLALLVAAALLVAYAWQPPEDRGRKVLFAAMLLISSAAPDR
jgi:hypothetical protein